MARFTPRLLVPMWLAVAGCAHAPCVGVCVRSLDLRGVHNVSRRALRSGLATRPPAWCERGPERTFDEVELDRDRKRIERYYQERGYYAATVELAEARHDPRGGVDVTIAVEEGAPTLIGDVRVLGVADVKGKARDELHRYQLGLRRGQVFHHDDYMKFKADLLRVLHEHGYPHAQVEGAIDVQPNSNLADITLVFLPGGAPRTAAAPRAGT